jgi:hypothetical protein
MIFSFYFVAVWHHILAIPSKNTSESAGMGIAKKIFPDIAMP